MKKFCNYTFQLVCIYIFVLTLFSIFNFDITKTNYNKTVHNVDEEKVLDSTLLVQSLQEEPEDDTKEEESINNEVQEEPTQEEQVVEEVNEPPKPVEIPNVNVQDVSGYAALASETVNISHYGHDCSGCVSGHTASGYYIGDGRKYYNDSTFGSVRIVAADYKYPEGTILRLNYYGNSFAAIVLDRGGGVGDHGKFQVDLLESNEYQALNAGTVYGASLEVLRYGY